MGPSFFHPPAASRYGLRRVHLPACLIEGAPEGLDLSGDFAACDLLVENGRIGAILPAGTLDVEAGPDLDGSAVLPGLVDCHAHLDKGHIWPRAPNPTGDVPGASAATRLDRTARWAAEDVGRRMQFGLETAYARGVVAIRTHLDSLAPQPAISFPVFREMRDRWAGRIDLQASSIGPLDMFMRDEGRVLADIVTESGGNLGCVTRFMDMPNDPIPAEFDIAMGRLFQLADERGLDIDLHVDEAGDPAAHTLIRVARIARDRGFRGTVMCGHCCALALQPDAVIAETLDLCQEAGIAIVSLPPVNMYLQSRQPGRTPRWRGVTVLHEMKARGLRVAVAGDNCRDPFYAYGDHDMLETFAQAVRILHLDHPFGDWLRSAAAIPAGIMRLEGRGVLRAGAPADLIVLRGRTYSEILSRSQFDRTVIRAGRAIDTTLPDYRQLDDLMR